ncbi:MAG: hypothetical protein NTU80_13015 [Verrucomicrobia bacterium]|nr:hypothetical protein [Verrucomicrobiota bacterium]
MVSYELVFSRAAAESFAALPKTRQRQAAVALDSLRGLAHSPGDLRQMGEDGRIHEVHLLGEWLLTTWTDHAAREIRVVALERTDEG